jgi:hypothetical protein
MSIDAMSKSVTCFSQNQAFHLVSFERAVPEVVNAGICTCRYKRFRGMPGSVNQLL